MPKGRRYGSLADILTSPRHVRFIPWREETKSIAFQPHKRSRIKPANKYRTKKTFAARGLMSALPPKSRHSSARVARPLCANSGTQRSPPVTLSPGRAESGDPVTGLDPAEPDCKSSESYTKANSQRTLRAPVSQECPLWVISRHRSGDQRCPLYPQKRTFVSAGGMSAKCQEQTHVSCASGRHRPPLSVGLDGRAPCRRLQSARKLCSMSATGVPILALNSRLSDSRSRRLTSRPMFIWISANCLRSRA
jgi:hypothetical protein